MLQEIEDLIAGGSVQVASGFISKNKDRFFDYSAGYCNTLLFTP
jgi:hypothetical protein